VDNDITWAYGFTGFAAAKIGEINDVNKAVYIDLIREKKLLVVSVAPATIIFMTVNQGS
jgi:hypothetical protein